MPPIPSKLSRWSQFHRADGPASTGIDARRATIPAEIQEAYPFAPGLDALARSTAHRAITGALLPHWAGLVAEERSTSIRTIDFGTGFGDLISELLAGIQEVHPRARFALQLIDADMRLAEYAAAEMDRRRNVVEARAATTAAVTHGRSDLILASHSLYYVEEWRHCIDQLRGMLAPDGRLTIVIRSTDCDTYKFRTEILRTKDRPRRSPRLTRRMVADHLHEAGAAMLLDSISTTIDLPCAEVSADALRAGLPHSDETELIRLFAHLPLWQTVPDAVVDALMTALDRRRVGQSFRIRLVDDILTHVGRSRAG